MARKKGKAVPRVTLEVGKDLRVPKLEYTDRWHETVKDVSAPYDGQAPYKGTIHSVAPRSEPSKRDLSAIDKLTKAADDTVTFYIKKYELQLSKHPDKMRRAEQLVDQARFYLAEARKLERLWRNGFYSLEHSTGATVPFGDVMPWPLNITWSKLHGGQCVKKGYGYKGKGKFDPSCPSKLEHIGHDADASFLENLLEAAAKSLHGAREISLLTYTYEVNKGRVRARGGAPRTRAAESGGPGATSAAIRKKIRLDPPATVPKITKATLGPLNAISMTAGSAPGSDPVLSADFIEDEEDMVAGVEFGDEEDMVASGEVGDEDFQLQEMGEEIISEGDLSEEDPEELIDESGEDPEGDLSEDVDESSMSAPEKKSGGGMGLIIAGAVVVGGLIFFGKK